MRPPLPAALVLAAALFCGCRTTTIDHPFAQHGEAVVAHLQPTRAWRIDTENGPVGFVVYFASESDPDESFYSVRNPFQQELGLIDGLGRSWRFRPHSEEPEWNGTGTVSEGARAILELEGPASLTDVPLATLEKTAPTAVR